MDWKGHLKAALIGALISSMFWGMVLVYALMKKGSLDWISWPRFAGMWMLVAFISWLFAESDRRRALRKAASEPSG